MFALPTHEKALKRLWRICFPQDAKETVDDFFERAFSADQCLVHVENSCPVSMTFLLDASFHTPSGVYPLQYIYAAATLPAYRSKGIFADLLKEAHAVGQQRGCIASFLHPGEPGLVSYYVRQGYVPYFYTEIHFFHQEDLLAIAGEGKTAWRCLPYDGNYSKRRADALQTQGAWVSFAPVLTDMPVLSAYKSGGGVLAGNNGCALCERRGKELLVQELVCMPEEFPNFCRALLAQFPCEQITLMQPAAQSGGDPYGLWYPLQPMGKQLLTASLAVPYLGLSLE